MTRKIKSLHQDDQILDLRPVNPLFVSRYRQAMRNGDKFPPLIIDRQGAIISGNHRYSAYLAEFGEDYEIEVIIKTYKTAAERIEDAIRDNAKHGNPLDGITRKRAVLILTELGRKPGEIANLLGVSVKRIEEMAGMSVMIVGGGTHPLKRGLEHMAGKKVTPEEYEEHRTMDQGVPAAQCAQQLIRWIHNGWIDWTDIKTVSVMKELRNAIPEKI